MRRHVSLFACLLAITTWGCNPPPAASSSEDAGSSATPSGDDAGQLTPAPDAGPSDPEPSEEDAGAPPVAPVDAGASAPTDAGNGDNTGGGGGGSTPTDAGTGGGGDDPWAVDVPTLPPPTLLSGYREEPPSSATNTNCSTGQWWFLADLLKGEKMEPGGNCIQCHTDRGEGPRYTFAGTVMAGIDDGENCRGIPEVTVEIIDANGATALSMLTNESGNFFSRVNLNDIALPYTAVVSYEGRQRVMGSPQTDPNCMNCHTDVGAEGAPGRILIP